MAGEGRKEEVGKTFEEGALVPCHQAPRSTTEAATRGGEWHLLGAEWRLVQGVHVRSKEDVEVEVVVQGTNLEPILKWASGSKDKVMRIHMCGAKCAKTCRG